MWTVCVDTLQVIWLRDVVIFGVVKYSLKQYQDVGNERQNTNRRDGNKRELKDQTLSWVHTITHMKKSVLLCTRNLLGFMIQLIRRRESCVDRICGVWWSMIARNYTHTRNVKET